MANSEDMPRDGDGDATNLFDFVPEQHESGYRARLLGAEEFKTATTSWRAGWQDADREVQQSDPCPLDSTPLEPDLLDPDLHESRLFELDSLDLDPLAQNQPDPTQRRSWQATFSMCEAMVEAMSVAVADQMTATTTEQTTFWDAAEAGLSARVCELPFDEGRGEVWKRSWVEADLRLGLRTRMARSPAAASRSAG